MRVAPSIQVIQKDYRLGWLIRVSFCLFLFPIPRLTKEEKMIRTIPIVLIGVLIGFLLVMTFVGLSIVTSVEALISVHLDQ